MITGEKIKKIKSLLDERKGLMLALDGDCLSVSFKQKGDEHEKFERLLNGE